MANFVTKSFRGGMNQQFDGSRLAENEYPLLVNGRNRYDIVTPVKLPTELSVNDGVPTGLKQGIYAADNLMLMFVAGRAYARDFEKPNSTFYPLGNFQMSDIADRIHATLVPGSTLNFDRKLKTSGDPSSGITYGLKLDGSYATAICQDGINQPRLIFPNGTVRTAQTFDQWTTDKREYVPVGRQMLFDGTRTLMIAQDGVNILRSVSGRPLDFMVNIKNDGNKADSLAEGGALTVAHAISYEEISALGLMALGVGDSGFFVSSKRRSTLVRPNTSSVVFGEPTFDNASLFPTGAMNNDSFIELLGDYAFIDFTGLRSFNSILQTRNQGKNAPFSKKVQRIFEGITQTSACCAVNFDNYGLFAVTTVYGPAIVVYDTLSESYVGLDIYPGVAEIKQFCVVTTSTANKLFFITTDNKLYEAFTGATAPCGLFAGEYCSNDPSLQFRPLRSDLIFVNAREAGPVTMTVYSDRRAADYGSSTGNVEQSMPTTPVYPLTLPFGTQNDPTTKMISLDVGRSQFGWKIGLWIQWQFDASLSHISLDCEDHKGITHYDESAQNWADARKISIKLGS